MRASDALPVMPGLVPGIHAFAQCQQDERREWPGHRHLEETPFFERLSPAMTKWIGRNKNGWYHTGAGWQTDRKAERTMPGDVDFSVLMQQAERIAALLKE